MALSFARSVAHMSFALRYSVLPLIDRVLELAEETSRSDIRSSAIDLQRFVLTRYFNSEQNVHSKPRVRKAPALTLNP